MIIMKSILILIAFIYIFFSKADESIIIQSTTSTKNSGFFDYILPKIYKDLGIKAHVVAVGTGAAIRNSMNCDGDLLIVHSPYQEKEFIRKGYAKKSHYFMHNYYIIIGPKSDPSKIKNSYSPERAFKAIFKKKFFFVSRGDSSGTHYKELSYWKKINLDPHIYSGEWYFKTGTGMGSTINIAIGLGAYTFTDKASWISFKNKQDFEIILQGNESLFNPYSALAINQEKCPFTKSNYSKAIIDWLLSEKGKRNIINHKKNGEQLYFVNN